MNKEQFGVRLTTAAFNAGFDPFPSSYVAAWIMLKARECNLVEIDNISDFLRHLEIEPAMAKLIISVVSSHWSEYLPTLAEATTDDLKEYLYADNDRSPIGVFRTPESILDFAMGMLDIPDGGSFVDVGSGLGSILIRVASQTKAGAIAGLEISKEANLIARLRIDIANEQSRVKVETLNAFSARRDEAKYDRAYCHPPFGLKFIPDKINAFVSEMHSLPKFGISVSTDWFFAMRTASLLKDGGRGIVILTNSAMSGKAEMNLRKYLVEQNLIHAVIELPSGLMGYSAMPITLVVLDKSRPIAYTDILLVDASEMGRKRGRKTMLSAEDVAALTACVRNGKPLSHEAHLLCKSVPRHEIEHDSFILTPRRYINSVVEKDSQGVPLGELVLSIRRGISFPAGELDNLMSCEPTGIHYVTQANIQDGIIDDSLPCLKSIPDGKRQYCATSGDLLLTKLGRPLRIACVGGQAPLGLIVSSNLYIISLKPGVVEPQWIKAYIESDEGQRALERLSVGETMPTVTIPDLKKLMIPMPGKEIRQSVVESYLEKQTRVAGLRKQLEFARKELFSVYNEAMKGTKE